MRNTLQDLKLAIDGIIIMSENLHDALDNLYDAKVPKVWLSASHIITSKCYLFDTNVILILEGETEIGADLRKFMQGGRN